MGSQAKETPAMGQSMTNWANIQELRTSWDDNFLAEHLAEYATKISENRYPFSNPFLFFPLISAFSSNFLLRQSLIRLAFNPLCRGVPSPIAGKWKCTTFFLFQLVCNHQWVTRPPFCSSSYPFPFVPSSLCSQITLNLWYDLPIAFMIDGI